LKPPSRYSVFYHPAADGRDPAQRRRIGERAVAPLQAAE
jgi:hypothetical protein